MTFRRIPPRIIRRTVQAIDRFWFAPRRSRKIAQDMGCEDAVTRFTTKKRQHKATKAELKVIRSRNLELLRRDLGMGGESEARHG